jgi:radical SAM superfamily enzyme YgiQ (UPF0313 family)
VKVLLVNPPTGKKSVVRDMMGGVGFNGGRGVVLPPIDLATMAATLESNGVRVGIYDANVVEPVLDPVQQYVQPQAADTVIVNISLPSLASDILFLKELKAKHAGQLIAKTGITFEPILQEVLRQTSVDFCIVGECETSIHEILSGCESAGTVRMDGGRIAWGEKKLIPDLDTLPLPARHLLENDKYGYSLLGPRSTSMQTSRGCVFPCAYYCPYPLVQGRTYRARTPRHVMEEIHQIVYRHKIQRILFRDAVFSLNADRTLEICERIRQDQIPVEWWCETRINCLSQELLCAMKKAGCRGINIGVETGDPQVLASQAKVGVTLDNLRTVRAICGQLGIRLHFLLMVGLPGETRKSIYQTYTLIREMKPESIGVTYITPYPGTPLFFEAREKGWIMTEDWSCYGSDQPVMRTDHLDVQDLIDARGMVCQGFEYVRTRTLKSRWMGALLNRRFQKWATQRA